MNGARESQGGDAVAVASDDGDVVAKEMPAFRCQCESCCALSRAALRNN